MAGKEKKTVYEIITERFTEQLRQGVVPWEKPWISVRGERVGGWSHTTGKPYSLINQMMLPSPGEYITWRQIQDDGGTLKKDAKGYPICFWKMYEQEVKDPNTNHTEVKPVPVLRYYTVYRVEDCEGVSYNYSEDVSELDNLKAPAKSRKADALFKAYLKTSGVKFKEVAQNRAYYNPGSDEIILPDKRQFKDKVGYYNTLFHEAVHSTGHMSRLNRFSTFTHQRGKDYSLEELVAEIGACAILYNLRLETKDSIMNSNEYLRGWLMHLHDDPRMIVKAAARAQKAVRYIWDGPEGIEPHNDVHLGQ